MALGDRGAKARRGLVAAWLTCLAGVLSALGVYSCGAPARPTQVSSVRAPSGVPLGRKQEAVAASESSSGVGGAPSSASSASTLPPLLHPERDTAWLGVELKDLERGRAGVQVERVFRGSPAFRAGIEAGDILLSLDGEVLSAPRQVTEAVRQRRPGARVAVGLERNGRKRLLPVELGSLPETEDLMRLHFVGLPAPPLGSLATVQGAEEWDWAALQGRVVVLEFWASWCAACRYLTPVLNRWHQRYRPQGVTLLGVTVDSVTVAARAARDLGMTYGVASDRSGKTTLAFAANQLPTFFVVDRHGIVRDVMVGLSEQRLQDLQVLVEQLIDAP